MTSPSHLTTLRSLSKNIPPSDLAMDANASTLLSGATPSDQAIQLSMATSTSLSAATPRIGHLLPHKPASMVEAAIAPGTLRDTEFLTYTADVKQLSETMGCTTKSSTTQGSQLDLMLLSKLPRELRDKIYRDAVVQGDDIPIRVTSYVTEDGERRHRLETGHVLMRACKQTRQEVADIYYLENTFRITDDLFGKQAIKQLSRLLAPWAQRMTKLGVSQTSVRSHYLTEINFSISASQGRIFIEPEPSSVQYSMITLGVSATTNRMTRHSEKVCFCKIFKLALKHDGCDIVSWMQQYVDSALQPPSQDEVSRIFDPVHCWTCAGRNAI